VPDPKVAVIVETCWAVTAEADAVKLAEDAPAATETVPGMPTAALLLVSVIDVLLNAGYERLIVQVAVAGPTSDAGEQAKVEIAGGDGLTVIDPGTELTWAAEPLAVTARVAGRPMLDVTAAGVSVIAALATMPDDITFWFIPAAMQVCLPPEAGAQFIDFPDELRAAPGCHEIAETLATG
jgi:hypothetical protein